MEQHELETIQFKKVFREDLVTELQKIYPEKIDIAYLILKHCRIQEYTDIDNNKGAIDNELHLRSKCSKVLAVLNENKTIEYGIPDISGMAGSRQRGQNPNPFNDGPFYVGLSESGYDKLNPIQQMLHIDNSIHNETHGHGSPIAGHNQEVNKISLNKEDSESKLINKKNLNVNKMVLILSGVSIIVAIVIYLLQRGHTT